jgi:hypothetical protein
MDRGDYNLSASTFTRSVRVLKSECQMHFVEIGGRGRKFELNLCNPNISIQEFETLDAQDHTRHFAGSAACPAPMFGADMGLPDSQKGGAGFEAARKRVLDIHGWLKNTIAPGAAKKDPETFKNFSDLDSDAKIACSEMLLRDYLEQCISIEAKPKEDEAPQKEADIPGVHPRTIRADPPKTGKN